MSTLNVSRARTLAMGLLTIMSPLLAGAANAANPAAADEAPPSITVRYQDLDLSGPQGVATLYSRIRLAAGEVCSPLESRDVSRKASWNACIDHAIADAVYAVHNRTLSAYHWQRTRGWSHRETEGETTLAQR